MTDQPDLSAEDELREQARRDIETPPEPVPGAEGLPDDVRDGAIEDKE